MPYLPSTQYKQLEGTDLSTGLVIVDGSGNQYVWIEVPKTEEVYKPANLNITEGADRKFTDEQYTAIENDLHEYTMVYRKGKSTTETKYKDEYDSSVVTKATGLSSREYTELKKKMLKSVYENGGFWIGRYEAGIGTNRTSKDDLIATNLKPTSKQNEYPLTYVTCSQAQTLASRVAPTGRTSSLMFGVQWDLVCKYLEGQDGLTTTTINSNSTTWGNYYNSTFVLNRGKYAKRGSTSGTWSDYTLALKNCVKVENGISTKLVASSDTNAILLTTGVSDATKKQNIYDIAGNVWEWTLEYTFETSRPCARRGLSYNVDGIEGPASNCYDSDTFLSDDYSRFSCCDLLTVTYPDSNTFKKDIEIKRMVYNTPSNGTNEVVKSSGV